MKFKYPTISISCQRYYCFESINLNVLVHGYRKYGLTGNFVVKNTYEFSLNLVMLPVIYFIAKKMLQ